VNIEEALKVTEHPDARRPRANHPKGFEPGVKFDALGNPEQITTPPTAHLGTEDDWNRAVEAMGYTVPAGYRLRLVEAKYDPAAWHRDAQGEDAVTRAVWRYRFAVEQITGVDEAFDHTAFLKSLRRNRTAVKPTHTGPATFGMSWNDWQTGKAEGGGTEALLERYHGQIATSKARIAELRKIGRNLGHLFVIGGGDIIEGCTIFPHQMMHIDADRRRQVDIASDMVLYGLDELAPAFESVTVLVVGGNHGENRIDGHKTNRSDNDDCLVFEIAAKAAARDDRLAHVNFVIAQGEPAKTIDVNGWIYATTHGQAFGKGAGRPEQKAHNWYKGQAGGRFPAGDADVLVSHHYHHKAERDWGACLWVQTPANDGGSLQHTDLTGESAESGMLTWVVTDESRYQDAQVL
jgi:hypothetical protein